MAALDTSTTTDVPALLPVGIAGHSYQMDVRGYRRQSVQMLRQQADTTDLPSEQSLNPQGPWRRSQESWHHGAGQTFFDGKTSTVPADPERYNTSAGVDVWTRGQVTLLAQTTRIRTAPATGFSLTPIAVGNHVYVNDSGELKWSDSPTTTGATWTSADINAGQAATSLKSIATNGNYVWAALDTSGLHRTARGDTSSTADVPAGVFYLVGYALGRLLVAGTAGVLSEVTNPISGPALSTVMTHPDSGFIYAGISPGRNCIYAFGNNHVGISLTDYNLFGGGTGEVFRLTLASSTALTLGGTATYLPDGESIHGLQFYAGAIIMATSRGLRVGVADAQGNIDYGPLINGAKPVVGLEPQGRYCWFTGENQGLHRIDLGYMTDTLTPAWAPDVVINITEPNAGIAKSPGSLVDSPNPFFSWYSASSGTTTGGVYRPTSTKVASGTLEPGQIRFGTTATKTLRRLEIRHLPLPAGATILCEMKRDGASSWTTIGTSSGTGDTSDSFDLGSLSCEMVELRFTLNRATDTTTGPTLTRWTLTALPTPRRDKRLTLPLVLRESVQNLQGEGKGMDIAAEVAFLETLWNDGTVFTLQFGAESMSAQIQDFQFEGESLTSGYADTNGYGSGRSVQGVYTVIVQTVG